MYFLKHMQESIQQKMNRQVSKSYANTPKNKTSSSILSVLVAFVVKTYES